MVIFKEHTTKGERIKYEVLPLDEWTNDKLAFIAIVNGIKYYSKINILGKIGESNIVQYDCDFKNKYK